MLIKRDGFPEESDLVLCNVTNIQHNSVFVTIQEYDKQGMIHISEIAPGRIRNIRDYVAEGKVVICKVLNVNEERGYIDLSLRRVSEGQRRIKSDEIKQELRAEKIIELTAHFLKKDFKQLYDVICSKLLPNYFYIYQAFNDIIAGSLNLHELFDKDIADALAKTIKDKIKPKEVLVGGDLALSVWEENGLDVVKKALMGAEVKFPEIKIRYLGGGKFRMLVKGNDYKVVEKTLKDSSDMICDAIKKHKGKAEYTKVENLTIAEAGE